KGNSVSLGAFCFSSRTRRTTTVSHACLPNHLVRPLQHADRNRQADFFRRLEINDEFKLRRLLYRQITGLCALENLIYVVGGLTVQVSVVRPIGHEAALIDKLFLEVNSRQLVFTGKLND